MSDSINVNVLVSAKDEYTNILKTLIGPLIHSGFEHMYNDAIRIEPRYTLRKFQEFCKETQRWNQFMIDNEVAKVKEQYDWIYDLITAIFVINVKILTSIRLGGDSKNINIKMPSLEKFIHKVYISSAERFYVNPMLFNYVEVQTDTNIYNKKEQCLEIIETSIDNAIKDLLPVQYILQEYLAKVMDESENGSNNGSNDGSEHNDTDNEQEEPDNEDLDEPGNEDPEEPGNEGPEGPDEPDNEGPEGPENPVAGSDDEICSNLNSDSEENKPVNKFGSQFRPEVTQNNSLNQPQFNPPVQSQPMVQPTVQPSGQPQTMNSFGSQINQTLPHFSNFSINPNPNQNSNPTPTQNSNPNPTQNSNPNQVPTFW